MIYLDYAANTPVDSQVLKTFTEYAVTYIGNPNSVHTAGRNAKLEMERITIHMAELLHVKPSEIIYTSGASESNNLALKGMARSYRHSGKHIISTCLEHSSVSGTLTALQEQGYEIDLVDIERDGTVNLDHLSELIRKDTVLVSVGMVDSELGTIQPIQPIARILESYPNCHFHVDATQAFGKVQVSFDGIDCVTFSPHKFYGLNGCGILVKKENIVLEPLIHGGAGTTIYRSGTPALALAASVDKAVELALSTLEERNLIVERMKSWLIKELKSYPAVRINSSEKSSPYILNLSVKGVKASEFQQKLDQKGVCISVKAACSVLGTPSRPVYAVSCDRMNALSSWRISLSHLTTEAEIKEFLNIFAECIKEFTE